MTEDINPGNYLIIGFEGTVPDSRFLRLIEGTPPRGFLFLEKNFESPDQLRSLISLLRKYTGEKVLFAVDQEPGRVQRFKRGFPLSRSPGEYLVEELVDNFRLWCAETAAILSDVGVNLNLAPVLDLGSGDKVNPVLRDRVFGDDPETVARFARILIEEHRKHDILTCGKHFPGLGAARFDPHERLSISREPRSRFDGYHWKPFIDAVNAGVDLIMTTHLKALSLDDDNPATFSEKSLEILRSRVGFRGPAITDDLDMGGATLGGSIGSPAISAIEAGHNLIIVSKDISKQTAILETIKNRYAQDEMFAKIAVANEKIVSRLWEKIDN